MSNDTVKGATGDRESCDLLLTPTAPNAAFAPGEKSYDPPAMYLNDVFTMPSAPDLRIGGSQCRS